MICPKLNMLFNLGTQHFSTKEKSSYSARTTWGVFRQDGQMNAMVLDMWYDELLTQSCERSPKKHIMIVNLTQFD